MTTSHTGLTLTPPATTLVRFVRMAAWLLCVGAFGCGPQRVADAPAPAQDVTITLERRPCFGTCPVYSITVAGDGRVRYEGTAHVSLIGSDTSSITSDQLTVLVAEFDRVGYGQMADRYAYGEPSCPSYVSDSPTTVTSLTRRGTTKRVEHDYGCVDAPRALTALERLIDDVVRSGQWTGKGGGG
jgi:hypothetical protein